MGEALPPGEGAVFLSQQNVEFVRVPAGCHEIGDAITVKVPDCDRGGSCPWLVEMIGNKRLARSAIWYWSQRLRRTHLGNKEEGQIKEQQSHDGES